MTFSEPPIRDRDRDSCRLESRRRNRFGRNSSTSIVHDQPRNPARRPTWKYDVGVALRRCSRSLLDQEKREQGDPPPRRRPRTLNSEPDFSALFQVSADSHPSSHTACQRPPQIDALQSAGNPVQRRSRNLTSSCRGGCSPSRQPEKTEDRALRAASRSTHQYHNLKILPCSPGSQVQLDHRSRVHNALCVVHGPAVRSCCIVHSTISNSSPGVDNVRVVLSFHHV